MKNKRGKKEDEVGKKLDPGGLIKDFFAGFVKTGQRYLQGTLAYSNKANSTVSFILY